MHFEEGAAGHHAHRHKVSRKQEHRRAGPVCGKTSGIRWKTGWQGGVRGCHGAGLGAKPNPVGKLAEADYNNIDCLMCHATGYRRTAEKDGGKFRIAPDPSIDALNVAQSVGKPTDYTVIAGAAAKKGAEDGLDTRRITCLAGVFHPDI